MDKLHRAGMQQMKVDAGYARIIDLPEELPEIRTALMPHPSLREKAAARSRFENPDAEIDVLSETHRAESAQPLPQPAADAHIERTRIELV